ncbi:hypothetical protein B0H11DRAFT_2254713 [Mycena galericulata]|nr:hypothetical protein B0H11DRAFT_2254713 [Mycena galericulata]
MASHPSSTRRRTATLENESVPPQERAATPGAKRRKLDQHISKGSSSSAAYLNPFGLNAALPLGQQTAATASNSNVNSEPALSPFQAYTQVPQERSQYNFSPVRNSNEQVIAPRTEKVNPFASTTKSSNTSAIDPTLLNESPAIRPKIPMPKSNTNRLVPFGLGQKSDTRHPIPRAQNLAPSDDDQLTRTPISPIMHHLPTTSGFFSSSSREKVYDPAAQNNHLFSPTPEPSLALPRPSTIPKAFTDRLMKQETRMLELESRIEDVHNSYNSTSREIAHDINDIDNEQIWMIHRIGQLEDAIEKQTKTIDQLFQLLEIRDTNQVSATADIAPRPKGGNRDNALNTATRQAVFTAMGLPKKSKLRDAAAVAPCKSGGSYIKDPESNGKILRPDWRISFADNNCWHDSITKFLRAKAPGLIPVLTRDIMKEKTDQELLERIEVVFKNISAEFRKAQKAGNDDDEIDAQPAPALTEEEEKKLNRRNGRKFRKCKERKDTISEAGLEIPALYSFFLQPVYQSTDESDDSDVVDPDTDTELTAEVPVRSTRKPWITRPPVYRNADFEAGITFIDKALMERRRRYEKDNKGKTTGHPRSRGPEKNTPLPFLPVKKQIRIRRAAIDPLWLSQHTDQDTPSRIHDSDNEEEPGPVNDEAEQGVNKQTEEDQVDNEQNTEGQGNDEQNEEEEY